MTETSKKNHTPDSQSQRDIESLYEEKLREFLKIRDRMIDSKQLKPKDINLEDILKSAIKSDQDLQSRQNTAELNKFLNGTNRIFETERASKIASPPSMRSLGGDPTLSENDLMLSENSKMMYSNNSKMGAGGFTSKTSE